MSKKVWIKLGILLATVLILVILIIQNTVSVELRLLFLPPKKLPLALLLTIVFLLGFVGGIVATFRINLKDGKNG